MRIQFLHDIYWKMNEVYWCTYARLAPLSATKSRFKKRMGYVPDLDNPQTLNEKMQYLKLHDYYKNPVITQCADKYAVRDYVKSKGCGDILNELFAVYNTVEEIDWGGYRKSSYSSATMALGAI